jgi:polyisoprenoid-binding protein YceI
MKVVRISFMFLCLFVVVSGFAQKYTAEKSFIKFYSDAAIEDITAENTKVATIFNAATGDLVFSVPMKEFQFEKSLMQEHFNEKYVESEKFPKATFQGKLSGYDLNKSGAQDARAVGKLTIHGVTRDIDVPGTFAVEGKNLTMKSKFMVKVADYEITIPTLLFQNIAEQVEVTVDFTYKPM